MGAFVPTLILCALPLTQIGGGSDNGQTVTQLKITVLHTQHAEIGSHGQLAPPTEGGGSSETYCQATPNSQGHTASIGHGGSLDLTQNTFGLTVTGQIVHPGSFGMFTFGSAPYNVPFGNGYLCVAPFAPGIFRMPTQALTQPTLVLAMEDAGAQFDLIHPGSSWYFQFWYRDLPAGGSNFNLSNGLHVVFAPAP